MPFFENATKFTINDGKFTDVAGDYNETNNSSQTWNTNSNNRTVDNSVNSNNNSSRSNDRTDYRGVGTVNNQSGRGNTQANYQPTQPFSERPRAVPGVRSMDATARGTYQRGMDILRREGRAGTDDDMEISDEDEYPRRRSSRPHGRQPQLQGQLPEADFASQPTLQHSQSEPIPRFGSNNPFANIRNSQGSNSECQPEAATAPPAQGSSESTSGQWRASHS